MNFQHLKNVSTLKFEVEKCKGCGICLNVCPRGVLVKNTEDNLVHIEKMNFCIECGACMINCPFGALTVDAVPDVPLLF